MTKRQIIACITALATLPAPVAAQSTQSAPPVSVDILVLPASGDAQTVAEIAKRTSAVSQGSADCNLNPPGTPPSPLINPKWAYFDDPFNAGRKCRAAIPAALPDGVGYRAVAVFTAAGTCQDGNGNTLNPCVSTRSAVGVPPFNIQPILIRPAAPTTVVVSP